MQRIASILFVIVLSACQPSEPPADESAAANDDATATAESTAPETAEEPAPAAVDDADAAELDRLAEVLDAQPEDIKARYAYRHPHQTLDFFGIEPGMTVVEALPGGGWYTRILLPYLGSDGHLIGANYALDMWPHFPFGTDEFMERIRQWPEAFPEQAGQWCENDCAEVSTFWLGSMPDELAGTADAVLFVRALHNLARLQAEGIDNYLDAALADAYNVLRPGGVFGVVQHQARADMPDDWADGSNGYLKQSFVIEQAEAAGFELVDESAINNNPDDLPATDEYVWRLPPSQRLPEDVENPDALRARYEAIGESHRMTLKFRKPEA